MFYRGSRAARLSGEIFNIAPVAVVVFRMRCHRDPHRLTCSRHPYFDVTARQIVCVKLNSVRDARVQGLSRDSRMSAQKTQEKNGNKQPKSATSQSSFHLMCLL